MSLDPKITLTLDRLREVKWTMASTAKLGRLAEPPALADITHKNPHRAFYAMLAWIWAAIDDREGEIAQPEDLAQFFQGADRQADGFAVLIKALRQAGMLKPEKKTPSIPGSPSAGSSASSGRTPSSSSGPRARRSKR